VNTDEYITVYSGRYAAFSSQYNNSMQHVSSVTHRGQKLAGDDDASRWTNDYQCSDTSAACMTFKCKRQPSHDS